MCERCEQGGFLSGLLARAGVAALPAVPAAPSAPAAEPNSASSPAPNAAPARRRKLWELEEKLHCPVVGACFNLDELKKLARKFGFHGKDYDPYRLHVEAVNLSCARNEASEAMQRQLERKYALVTARFNRLRDDDEVRALWKACLEQGDVAGPFWAVLTHKAASRDTCHIAYGDVHMLSHQIGAGQAADLRRLETLERDHATLRVLHQSAKSAAEARTAEAAALSLRRDALQAELREQAGLSAKLLERVRELESGQAFIALGRRLLMAEAQALKVRDLATRVQGLEERNAVLRADKARLSRELQDAAGERDALERLWLAEADPAQAASACDGACDTCPSRLQGRCVLCVGGRTPLLPQYRQLAERMGVKLLHHDGGKEEHLSRLPELLKASDAVICPTDCVGHLAYYQLKKHCKQNGKPCVLAKSSGVAGFAAALTRLAEGRADIRAQT